MRELRKTGAPALTGVPGATLLVGGIPALNADYQTIIEDRFVPVTRWWSAGRSWRCCADFGHSSPP